MGRLALSDNTEAEHFAALIEAVATDHDREAFAALFDHFAPRLKAFFMRAGANPSMSEELVQESMLVVWRRATLFDRSKASASTWIYTIARNKRIDRLRRERRPEYDPNDPALVPAPETGADSTVEATQWSCRVRDAMGALPAEQRRVLDLHYFEDKSQSTIAEELTLPLGTVKSRLRLALKRLRSALEEDW